jgi:hypothetical protein
MRVAWLVSLVLLVAGVAAAVACGPDVCPRAPPESIAPGIAPQFTSVSAGPPLSCPYFIGCGEVVCVYSDGWSCAQVDGGFPCDAGDG